MTYYGPNDLPDWARTTGPTGSTGVLVGDGLVYGDQPPYASPSTLDEWVVIYAATVEAKEPFDITKPWWKQWFS